MRGGKRATRIPGALMAAPSPLSPLAPKKTPTPPPIAGVRFSTIAAGVRYAGRTDVMLALFDEPANVAGVFTRSRCPSAPVDWCRDNLAQGKARALIVNSGNANAFTGGVGARAVAHVAEAASAALKIPQHEIFMASTGVIGEPLDGARIAAVINTLGQTARPEGLNEAARAIMTTDTFPKVATARVLLGETEVSINGFAKGAGMIAPDMATMLAFIFTDAPIAAAALQAMLSKSVERSFNAITVDSDTSTSDTLMLFATGAAAARGAPAIEAADDARLAGFKRALDKVLLDLAHQVVRDGEGARKFIAIKVEGARSRKAAKRIALSIANSPLVKTAVAGEDANWGRIVMAVGKAGERAERDRLDIHFGPIRVAHNGMRDPDYDEAAASAYMKKQAIDIRVNVGVGSATAKVWTCDLTKEYIAINGDYRS
jgi:glutamate N-acetyltransferase/amino-acid N-acetyltransferase